MAVKSSTVTVAATATALNGAESDLIGGSSLAMKVPTGGATVYVGGSDVTTSNGYPVAAGEAISLDIDPAERVYAIVASSTQAVNVLTRGA